MPSFIRPHKWPRLTNTAEIERFWYTDNGILFRTDPDKMRQWHAPGGIETNSVNQGRIALLKDNGKFFVRWSTSNMKKLVGSSLPEIRKMLRDYLDTIRTGHLVDDMDKWAKVIYHVDGEVIKGLMAVDADGKVVRRASWDERKKQFVPEEGGARTRLSHAVFEAYSDERYAEAVRDRFMLKELQAALDDYERAVLGKYRSDEGYDIVQPAVEVRFRIAAFVVTLKEETATTKRLLQKGKDNAQS